jgi:hypothetical protein
MYEDHNHEDEEEEIKKMAVENACKDRVAYLGIIMEYLVSPS